MDGVLAWLAVGLTVALLLGYEALLVLAQRRHPERLARSAHAALRETWFDAVSAQPGSEILAVQTLRNSLMSATMTASTAVLGLMGAVTLAAPSLHASLGAQGSWPSLTHRLVLELALMALLFGSLLASVMAVRFYNHASFVVAMPVGAPQRLQWAEAGRRYVRRAGLLYSWGLHHLVLVAPLLAAIAHPAAGPVAAVLVIGGLYGFDRVGTPATP